MPQQAPRAIRFIGGTPFAVAMHRLWGHLDSVGDWLTPAEHLVHPDDAELIKELLDGDSIPYSTRPEYIEEALYRADDNHSS